MNILNDEEIKAEKRKKQLAILKASNELLRESMEKTMEQTKLTEVEKAERFKQFNEAMAENEQKAQTYLNASKQEIEASVYGDVSEEYKKKYQERLEKRGATDEQLRNKSAVSVSASASVGKGGIEKKRRSRKRGESAVVEKDVKVEEDKIVKVPNEDALMRMSQINSDEDLKRKQTQFKKDAEDGFTSIIKEAAKSKKVKSTVREAVPTENKSKVDETGNEDSMVSVENTEDDTNVSYNFDFSSIPDYIQYDVIPLPSKGECYSHKKGRVPVAYLTASDENIIASPNMYRDGKIVDVILSRKILDKDFKVDELCKGDRDAIALWLRATGYGPDFPVIVTHPDTGKKYDITVNLGDFKFLPFKLKSDKDGLFTWKTERGDVLKFKFMSFADETKLRDKMMSEMTDANVAEILINAGKIEKNIKDNNNISDDLKSDLQGCVDDIREMVKEIEVSDDINNDEMLYSKSITNQMTLYTVSVNGNTDRDYIKGYIENMRSKDAYNYRSYILDNKPGVDFKMSVDVPEADGGGRFDTFLRIDDTIFLNI